MATEYAYNVEAPDDLDPAIDDDWPEVMDVFERVLAERNLGIVGTWCPSCRRQYPEHVYRCPRCWRLLLVPPDDGCHYTIWIDKRRPAVDEDARRAYERALVNDFERRHGSLQAGLWAIANGLKDPARREQAVADVEAAALYAQYRAVRPVEIRRFPDVG